MTPQDSPKAEKENKMTNQFKVTSTDSSFTDTVGFFATEQEAHEAAKRYLDSMYEGQDKEDTTVYVRKRVEGACGPVWPYIATYEV